MKASNNDKAVKTGTSRPTRAAAAVKTGEVKSTATVKGAAGAKTKTDGHRSGTAASVKGCGCSGKEKDDEHHSAASASKRSWYTGEHDSDFHTFFVDEIKDIYWAEKHLRPALSKMCRASTSEELAAAFDKHYGEGRGQIDTLETIFGLLGEKPEAKRCDAMAGLLKEAESIIEDTKRNSYVRDAGLILAAQKVEHYEIATYGTLLALSEFLPEKKIRQHLSSILSEEKKTDAALTKLAQLFVNECAAVE